MPYATTTESLQTPERNLGISPLGMVLVALAAVTGLAFFLNPESQIYDVSIGSMIVLSIALSFGSGLQKWRNEADLKRTFLYGLLGSAVVSIIAVVVGITFFSASTTKQFSRDVLLILSIPAIFEELLFRGGVLPILQRVVGMKVAVLIQAVLFATYHTWAGLDVARFITLFAGGIVLALIFLVTKNLLASIIAHLIINLKPYAVVIMLQPATLVVIALAVAFYIVGKRM